MHIYANLLTLQHSCLHTFVAQYDVNVGGHVEHELQRIRLRPVNRFAVNSRRPRTRRTWADVPAAGAADRRRFVTGGQIAVDGADLADCRYSMADYRCVGGRLAVVGGDGDGEVDDGEVNTLSWLSVKTPRTTCWSALQMTCWGGGGLVEQTSVDQVAVVWCHLHRLWPRTAALSHRLTLRNWTFSASSSSSSLLSLSAAFNNTLNIRASHQQCKNTIIVRLCRLRFGTVNFCYSELFRNLLTYFITSVSLMVYLSVNKITQNAEDRFSWNLVVPKSDGFASRSSAQWAYERGRIHHFLGRIWTWTWINFNTTPKGAWFSNFPAENFLIFNFGASAVVCALRCAFQVDYVYISVLPAGE